MNKKITIIIFILLILVVAALALFQTKQTDQTATISSGSQANPEELASNAAAEINKNISFPNKLSDTITWNSLVASGKTLHYSYIVTSSNDEYRAMADSRAAVNRICAQEDITTILDQGVDLQVSFTNSNTGEQRAVLVKKDSCND